MLAFTSVYFLESRPFNGLQAFGVKKFADFAWSRLGQPFKRILIPAIAPQESTFVSGHGKTLARIQLCSNQLHQFLIMLTVEAGNLSGSKTTHCGCGGADLAQKEGRTG
jgi:hypothetical protein